MSKMVVIAGIDVSKDKLDIHVLPSNQTFVVSRDPRGLSSLARRLRKAGVEQVALEASGDYERIVIETLEADGFVVQLLNPARVRAFAEAIGILAKTDPIDARLIALYCQHFPDKGLTRRPEQARKLGEFLNMRDMLLKLAGEIRNSLEHVREPGLKALADTLSADVAAKLKDVEHRIARVIADDDASTRKAQIIRSFTGAGPVLTSSLLARVPELGGVTRHAAARLCRAAPTDRQSGRTRHRSSIEGGRDHVRPVLHMAALAAMRSNPIIKAFAQRLSAAGKPKKLVIAACARKMVVILNAMLRDNTEWKYAKAA
jgi:transposase